MATVREAITAATRRLAADPHLVESGARDAEHLLLHTLQLARSALFAHPERDLSPAEQARFDALIARRLTHEPIQYLTGEQEFYGLPFLVTPAVLIPRPETEHLVEAVLQHLPQSDPRSLGTRILDVGTGTGILAITLALQLPHAEVTALDLSPEALAIVRSNAERHGVSARIRLLQSDLLGAVHGEIFDVIVSNPPYIPDSDRATLHPQVRNHEPAQALFAADDGFGIYTRLIPQASAALRSGGLLALEIGYSQQERIASLLQGWDNLLFINDLQAIPRVALATRP